MAVHLPLSIEAQIEARTLMLSVNNIFSPASGEPIITPSQDIVLGCYYLTACIEESKEGKRLRCFNGYDEVFIAYAEKKVGIHAQIKLRLDPSKSVMGAEGEQPKNGLCTTTVTGNLSLETKLEAQFL